MINQAKTVAQNLRGGWPFRGADARIMCEGAADTIDALVAGIERLRSLLVDSDSLIHDLCASVRSQAAEIERLKEASDFDHAEYKRLHDAQAAEIERLRGALRGFYDNSLKADWPSDIYEAARAALGDKK